MDIGSILAASRTRYGLQAASKKRVLQKIALHIHESLPKVAPELLFQALIARERLGSTGVGHGIAIPHCRLSCFQQLVGGLYVTEAPVDFAAPDDRPVDLFFVLLVPEAEQILHLQTLSLLAKFCQDADYVARLRTAGSDRALFVNALTHYRNVETAEAPDQAGH